MENTFDNRIRMRETRRREAFLASHVAGWIGVHQVSPTTWLGKAPGALIETRCPFYYDTLSYAWSLLRHAHRRELITRPQLADLLNAIIIEHDAPEAANKIATTIYELIAEHDTAAPPEPTDEA